MVGTRAYTVYNTKLDLDSTPLQQQKTALHLLASFPNYRRKKYRWFAALTNICKTNTEINNANKPEQCIQHEWYSTCLENNLLATNTCSLQVNEGSHLLGPRMLSNETVTGLMERRRVSGRESEESNRENKTNRKRGAILN